VTHYALDINGKMREAVPVDKAKATRIFEEIEQRQVDPGLIERVEGNNFRMRVYPVPAKGTRTISIGYEEELPLENKSLRYRLPMAYHNQLKNFSVKATVWKSSLKPIVPESAEELLFDRVDENYVATFTRRNYRPTRALNFALPVPIDIPQVITQSAQGSYYFFASVAPNLKTRKKCWDKNLAVIWDVSLSGSQRDLKREMDILDIIFTEKKNANVHLYFLNNMLTEMVNKGTTRGEYKVRNGNWEALKNILEKAVFDGGTDFSQINLNNIIGDEILFFSDGISTLSEADSIKNISAKRPIHCVVSSARADYGEMRLIAGRTMGKFVNLNALSPDQLIDELLNETPQFLGIERGKAIREVYPSIASPVHGKFSLSGISDVNDAEVTLLFGFGNKIKKRFKVKLNTKSAGEQGNLDKFWAQKKIAELDLKYAEKRDELMELGQQFGIVTRYTSLIVLETVEDYIRYDITPPAELLAEYLRRRKKPKEEPRDAEESILEKAVAAADTIKTWWNTDFSPKQVKYPTEPDPFEYPPEYGSGFGGGGGGVDDLLGGLMGGGGGSLEIRHNGCSLRVPSSGAGLSLNSAKDEKKAPTINIKNIRNDNDYLKKLTGKSAEDYQLYLKLRIDYAGSPTFYFDMADWFYKHNDKKTAILVLTSIADLELEEASLYRLLGYRFKEYGEYTLEKFVCKKVIKWRPMEPQSYRDYALALADNGETQAALDSLYGMLTKSYSENTVSRSDGIEEVVVMEMNRLIAKNITLNKSKIDKRVRVNPRVDIRVVINWNMDNTDIDLHITDPNDEDCYYGHRETEIGGRISVDNTRGYGPEQFLLKKAIPGKYRIVIDYFGDSQFTNAGPSTIMAEIYTKYADKTEQRKVVCLQLSKKNGGDNKTRGTVRDNVEVAEFEF
jgi:tetratricopeptide (TPR) repeat protein